MSNVDVFVVAHIICKILSLFRRIVELRSDGLTLTPMSICINPLLIQRCATQASITLHIYADGTHCVWNGDILVNMPLS